VLALAAGLAACGGDDDDDDDAAGGDAPTEEASAACDAYADVQLAFAALFESEDPADVQAAYEDSNMGAKLDALDENSPEEIADATEAATAAVRDLGETGDPTAIEAVDSAPIDEYYFENCDFETLDVTATEYEFGGLPDEAPAGLTSVKFTNDGTQLHEIALVRRNEGTTQSVDELLAMSEEESGELLTFVGATGGAPGDTQYFVSDLEPGDYIAVCFVSDGTTSEDAEGDGPPHATLGMVKEFTVA
jgi:hypothetical protein